jgi:hypothetical protein
MAKSQEELLQDILTELRGDARRPRDRGGNNRDREETTGATSEAIKVLTEKIGAGLGVGFDIAARLGGKALDQTATVSDVSGEISRVLGEFGSVGGVAGDLIKGLTDVLVDAVDNWQHFSDSGLQFGGNATAMNEAVKKTGLTFRQYDELVQTAMPAFAAFGRGLSAGAEYFGEASKMMLDKFGNDLGKLGMGSVKELNAVLAITARGMQTIDPSTAGMEQLTIKAMRLANELDKTAQMTGISRKEQEKNIRAMQDDMRIQAQLARMRRTDPQMAAQIQAGINASAAFGPELQKIIAEGIAGKGVIGSKKMGELNMVVGPELATQLMRATADITSKDPQVAARAAEILRKSYGDMSMDRGSSKSGALGVQMGALTGDIAREVYGGANNGMAIYQANMDKLLKEAGGDYEKARQRFNKIIENNQKGILNEDITIDGKTYKANEDFDPRAKSTEMIVGVEQDIKRIGRGLTELMTEINRLVMGQRTKNDKSLGEESANATRNQVRIQLPDGTFKDISAVTNYFDNAKRKTVPNLFNQPGNQGVLDPVEEAKKRLGINPTSPIAPAPAPKAPAPDISKAVPRVETRVSAAEPANTSREKEPNLEMSAKTLTDQEQVIEKLGEISTIMARVEHNTKNTARHAQDTASNIKEVGPYVR